MQNMRRVPMCNANRMGNANLSNAHYASTHAQQGAMPTCEEKNGINRTTDRTTGNCLNGMPSLAMVYVPCQAFSELYDLDNGLKNGTIFRTLNMPFQPGYGKRGCGQ